MQADHVRRNREQGLRVNRDLDLLELVEELRALEGDCRPCHALADAAHHAVQVHRHGALVSRGLLHRRGMPRDQQFRGPFARAIDHGVLPAAVPVAAEVAAPGDGRVLDAVAGGQGEVVAAAAIAVEVQHHVDPVDRHVLVTRAALARGFHAGDLGVAEGDRQPVRSGQDPGFRRVAGRGLGERLHHPEVGDVARALPFGGIDRAIHLDLRKYGR